MNRKLFGLAVFLALATVPACARTSYPAGFQVDVLVDSRHVPVYFGHGLRYVEAIKGKKYSIRLRNPLGVRVAVALSVDGLNTIDARHTDPRPALRGSHQGQEVFDPPAEPAGRAGGRGAFGGRIEHD